MSNNTQGRTAATSKSGTFQHREGSGSLFYDAPGVPTLTGAFTYGKSRDVTAEPAVDKNQKDYVKIAGDGVSGALYPNERKEAEKHPDFTGPIEIDGEKLRISAWTKQTKSGANAGQDFLSVAVSEPRQQNG